MNGEYQRIGRLTVEVAATDDEAAMAGFGKLTEVYLCPVCSALVGEPEKHDSWHGNDE